MSGTISTLPSFVPCPWLKNAHAQTITASLLTGPSIEITQQKLQLPDGDFVNLYCSGNKVAQTALIILHGLEGSCSSPYVQHFLQLAHSRNYYGILLQARGAAQHPNTRERHYNSGNWRDANFLMEHLRHQGIRQIITIGVSLGGNQLLKWLGECGDSCPIDQAIAISVPFELGNCVRHIENGFSRIYEQHLLKQMQKSLHAKEHIIRLSGREINKLSSIRELDRLFTAPIHGYIDENDYYSKNSSRQFLGDIRKPCLIIQAKDDPFVPRSSQPALNELSKYCEYYSCEHGGHVGFLTETAAKPWLPRLLHKHLDRIGL